MKASELGWSDTMLINLSDVITSRVAGEVDTGHLEKQLDIKSIDYCGETAKLNTGVQIVLDITKSDEKSVRLDGSLAANLQLTCSRCNNPLDYSLKVEFEKVISSDSNKKEDEKADDEFEGILQGGMLDVEALAINEMLLNYPMKVLCMPTCKGICQTCGMNQNEGSCTCDKDDIDPRWLGLKSLYNEKFKEV